MRPTYRLTRSVLLRGLGLVYASAFASLAVQLDGLIGSRGILPAAEFLDRAGRILGRGPATFWRLPTLFWLDASDPALHVVCWGGVVLGVLVVGGFLPGVSLALLWLFYLSLTVAGQVFLGYQWDSLLLEAGSAGAAADPVGRPSRLLRRCRAVRRLAVPLAGLPPDVPVGRGQAHERRPGLVDLEGARLSLSDPAAADLDELVYPPDAGRVPNAIHRRSCSYAELVAPFFIFGPRILRRIGFVSLVLLQVLIAATGNYGFFNLLTAILCLSVLDDRDWKR